MYYISKFCRICVQTNVELLDLDSLDFDKVKLSEKLQLCTRMVVTRESFSSEICLQCISKLRTSYQFLEMCKKSTKKFHDYYKTLLSMDDNEEDIKNFVNTDLHVVVSPIEVDSYYTINDNIEENETQSTREKRKRITKEQRCSLLKKLLSNPEHSKQTSTRSSKKYMGFYTAPSESFIGGLKSIINFTKNYEFGVGLDNLSYEATPLEKLTAFSNQFFRTDFSEFKNTILYIIENKDNLCDSADSEDEEYVNITHQEETWHSKISNKIFKDCDEMLDEAMHQNVKEETKENIVKFEEVIVEPDIKIKTEMEYEEGECQLNDSLLDSKLQIKEESESNEYCSNYTSSMNYNSDYTSTPPLALEKLNSMMSLNNFVGNYQHKRNFSPNNVRCRTRDNPYINPLLKQQFLYRSFKCDKCSRYFKSPGYLKAHHSKVH
ncbi:uncharacterized protein LOC130441582 [Diorhabda sublineata]|uniref:uncharacterized protein LOC130441582 n=1 Tax=Diorhabda sublineata TaxID=1163346 RepID=UPI0024E0D23F|nr:uncharacterized protein LOC130441582 [Diorhabda sublineata]